MFTTPVTKRITAGTQDNGTIQQSTPDSKNWNAIMGGDGGVVCVDTLVNPGFSVLYYSAQNLLVFSRVTYNHSGTIISVERVTLTNSNFRPKFYTPIKTNSVVGGRLLLAGADSVYESLDKGDTLTDIGITDMGNCSCIAYGGMKNGIPNPNIVYACKGDKVYLRTSSNQTLTPTPGILPTTLTITSISIDTTNWERAFIVSNAQPISSVYMTTNAGETWIDITGTLATSDIGEIYSSEIIRHPTSGFGGLVVGTEYGVWLLWKNIINNITSSTTSTSIAWVKVGTQIPNVQINNMDYNAADDILVIGTLGRGAWSIRDFYPITSMVLRVTKGSTTYEQPISNEPIAGANNNQYRTTITNPDLINAFNLSPDGTIFNPSIVATYESGAYSAGNEVVTPSVITNYVPKKIIPVLTFANIPTKTTGDVPFSLSDYITKEGTGVLMYESSNHAVATIQPSTDVVMILGEGTTTITITLAASADQVYTAVSPIQKTLVVMGL